MYLLIIMSNKLYRVASQIHIQVTPTWSLKACKNKYMTYKNCCPVRRANLNIATKRYSNNGTMIGRQLQAAPRTRHSGMQGSIAANHCYTLLAPNCAMFWNSELLHCSALLPIK